MHRRAAALLAVLVALLLCVPSPALAGRRKKKASRARPTPTAGPLQGPPAPTPLPLLRAAGTCLDYEPGQFLLLAEVGATGRMFRVSMDTDVTTPVHKGTRIRVLYLDERDGPVARRILPGPTEAEPTAGPVPRGP